MSVPEANGESTMVRGRNARVFRLPRFASLPFSTPERCCNYEDLSELSPPILWRELPGAALVKNAQHFLEEMKRAQWPRSRPSCWKAKWTSHQKPPKAPLNSDAGPTRRALGELGWEDEHLEPYGRRSMPPPTWTAQCMERRTAEELEFAMLLDGAVFSGRSLSQVPASSHPHFEPGHCLTSILDSAKGTTEVWGDDLPVADAQRTAKWDSAQAMIDAPGDRA
ncbi:uncharacterized protein N7459_007711 [Penicillium hispanicum]|uniref:uncharacterized protein n=1 Tax=Penicillium hispanicum TaxID=1080232 RepID=UPI0025413C0D|nr:uncharacterized protein N7459_007711 [Penicillium hispanicum]KAJ5578747.1 hypothetical protein N7459_007711 [Penicillium hispanicum]